MKPDTVYPQCGSPIAFKGFIAPVGHPAEVQAKRRLANTVEAEPSRVPAGFLVYFFACALLNGCSSAGAPSFELFGAFFPGWLLCGLIGLLASGAARGFFVGTRLSELVPYQLLVCVAIGVSAACLAYLFWFGW